MNIKFNSSTTFFSDSPVKFLYRGSNFTAWFKDKEEPIHPGSNLTSFILEKYSTDAEIISKIGGESKAEVTLQEIWQLLVKQPIGESGILLTNGYSNIFYVKDKDAVLRAVRVDWYGGGWRVGADALGGDDWGDDSRLFARNSEPVKSESSDTLTPGHSETEHQTQMRIASALEAILRVMITEKKIKRIKK